jgi:hypothetical protein
VIAAERLVDELEAVCAAACRPPKVSRMDNGQELLSQALQRFCDGKVGVAPLDDAPTPAPTHEAPRQVRSLGRETTPQTT